MLQLILGDESGNPIILDSDDQILIRNISQRSNILNFTPCDFRVMVGDLDITRYITGMTVSRNRADISRPLVWQGNIDLSAPADHVFLEESLDDLENPVRWLRGNQQVILYIKEVRVMTLRIASVKYDEDDWVSQIEVVDLLGLLDYKSPPKDWKDFGYNPCRSVPVSFHLNKILLLAGFPCVKVGNVPGIIQVAPSEIRGTYVQTAQRYCGERGYWLYLDPLECVRAIKYEGGNDAPPMIRSRYETEFFERDQGDLPDAKITVTATGEIFSPCNEDDGWTEEKEYGYYANFSQLYGGSLSELNRFSEDYARLSQKGFGTKYVKRLTRRRTKYRARGKEVQETIIKEAAIEITGRDAAIRLSDPTALITSERTEVSSYYDSEGRLRQRITDSDIILGRALPDDFAESKQAFQMVRSAKVIEEEWRENVPNSGSDPGTGVVQADLKDDGVVRYKGLSERGLFAITVESRENADSEETSERKTFTRSILREEKEQWEGGQVTIDGCVCDRYKYRKRVWERGTLIKTTKFLRGRTDIITDPSGGVVRTKITQPGTLNEVSELAEYNEDAVPPAWETQPPFCPTCQIDCKSVVYFRPDGWLDNNPLDRREYEYNAETLDQCYLAHPLAVLIGNLQQQRFRARKINWPTEASDEWIIDPRPFRRIWCHNGSFIADGDGLVLTTNEFEWNTTGNYLGRLNPPILPAPPVPVYLPEPVEPCNPGEPIPTALRLTQSDRVAYIGVEFPPMQLVPNGGTAPYSFSLSGLPPGLSSSDGLIYGIPETEGSYTVTVTIADSVSNILVVSFAIEILPALRPQEPSLVFIPVQPTYTYVFTIDQEEAFNSLDLDWIVVGSDGEIVVDSSGNVVSVAGDFSMIETLNGQVVTSNGKVVSDPPTPLIDLIAVDAFTNRPVVSSDGFVVQVTL